MRKIAIVAMMILSLNTVVKADDPTAPMTEVKADVAEQPKAVDIEKIAVGTAIDNKELTGTAKEFDASMNRVYCWTKVTASNPPTKINHVWYAEDKQEAEVPLEIKYSSMRTWSSKNVWPGRWKVEVTSDSGEVLSSTDFTVQGK